MMLHVNVKTGRRECPPLLSMAKIRKLLLALVDRDLIFFESPYDLA